MDVLRALRAYVLADPAIAAQIGDRLWPSKLPQHPTLPAMTMKRISGVRFGTLRGRAGLARPRYQFDIWVREGTGSAAAQCQRIGRLLLARLEGKNVQLADTSVSPPALRRFSFEFIDDEDIFEQDVDGGLHRHQADYYVFHHTGNN